MLATMLKQLDFASPNGKLVSGLVALRDGEEGVKRLDERLAVRDAIAIKHVDFVFFRRFSDNRSSQVVAYVVDNADNHLSEKDLADLHKRVWLHGGVPLIYVAWPTRLDVLTCARGPDFWHHGKYEYAPAQKISQAIHGTSAINVALDAQYSALRLIDGTFWDDPRNSNLAKSRDRAHERLIAAVVETDEALHGDKNPLLRRLLLLTVLIKYLEDRRVFPTGWFGGFCKGATSFFEALRDGQPEETVRLLANLEKRFNGDIFALPGGAAQQMTKPVLKEFAKLVEAKTINKQKYLWEQFSFEHIPVEIVSHLYQRFVKGGHGTVYTPPFLASLLLDHAMPYDTLKGNERVLDPACGSGVFLVGAFRRLANVHRAKNFWNPLDVATLKKIVKKCIFGIELDSGAVDLASFSLALAVCDMLRPDVIWEKLKFDRLRNQNLIHGDFFDELRKKIFGQPTVAEGGFDIILGNPPFESELTVHGVVLNEAAQRDRGILPDKQAAYLFLEQGIKQLRPRGRLCLIQPSQILHNSNAYKFRKRIFENASVDLVMDFTSIRKLYDAADPKTIAILATAATPSASHKVVHLTFRRTFGTLERVAFEIDHYDWHWVTQDSAVEDMFVWRLNLLGGGRLVDLSNRLRDIETLKELVKRKGLRYNEGFIAGKKNRKPFSFLKGMKYLHADALTEHGIDESKVDTVSDSRFKSSPPESAYQAPLILLKKHETLPIGLWKKGPIAFAATLVGVGFKKNDPLLKQIYDQLSDRHRTYQLSCMMHGSSSFVAKATKINKQDIDFLPMPERPSDLDLSFWERAIEDDTLNYFCNFIRLGQNSDLLKKAVSPSEMVEYASLFCKMLGTVYDDLHAEDPLFLEGLVCQAFYFGSKPATSLVSSDQAEALHDLIYRQNHESIRTVRMVRFYTDNLMLIIKPNRLRFWIKSTAIRDADETIIALCEQGY
ncbi:MAG: N-6 DNA methylase [Planctomycetaceae bacterium]|nr:N-6 DNA methylase [Planctomycetaceae bacterium]